MTPSAAQPVNQPASSSRRRFLKLAFSAALLGSAVGAAQGVDTEDLKIEDHKVQIKGWPKSAAGLKIGHLSDFHVDCKLARERTERSVAMLLAQKPDVVFLTGDFVTYKPHIWAHPCARALAPLANVPGGAYGVLGNHDWWSNGKNLVARSLEEVGITMLRNDSRPLCHAPGVWIVGLDDRCVGKEDPERALRNVPQDAVKLLLVHEPDYADEAPPVFAFQFSGHSHGGQIRCPGLPPLHTPKYGRDYPEGLQMARNHPVYTTRGVGVMGPQLRLFCPPEVTLLRVYPV
jgi:predicted MPP superfamily phosphohydrolase